MSTRDYRPGNPAVIDAIHMSSDQYRCLKCKHTWEQVPQPRHSGVNGRFMGYERASSCPKCGHQYVEWLTYEAEQER